MSMQFKNIKSVLFDFDDTLVATREIKWAQHRFVAKKYYGKDLTHEEFLAHWGKPFPQMICLYYGTDNVEEARKHVASCYDDYHKVLYKESIPALKALHNAGKLIGIITASGRPGFEKDIATHHFPMEIIGYVQTADDTKFHKPDPRVFDPAIKFLKDKDITPKEVLYIGDGLHDMKAALDAGMHFLGVETGLVTHDQFVDKGAQSVPNISNIIKYLAI